MNKFELCENLDKVLKTIEQSNLGNKEIISKIEDYKKNIETFRAKIPVIGSFSAGKTALINAFLGGEELFKEDQNPTTAIATEICFSPSEYVELVGIDGDVKKVSIDEAKSCSIEGYSKFVYYLNRQELKALSDLIIVDLPGFNSGIEAHNRAIYGYIGEAAAYVYVTNVEKGTLTKQETNFLHDVIEYAPTIKYILTKTDKVLPETVQNVKNEISSIIKNETGQAPDILTTSSRNPECCQDLSRLMNSFSIDNLLAQKFCPDILSTLEMAIHCMKVKKSANYYDPHDSKLYIYELEEKKNGLERKFEQEKNKLHLELQNSVVIKVIKDVESALYSSIDSIVSSAKLGGDKLNNTINDIVRPILVTSTQKQVDLCLGNFVDSFYESLSKELDFNEINIGVNAVKSELDMAISLVGESLEKMSKFKSLYKIVSTGLAVTTSVVAPVIELIIIFLPEIISLINTLMGRSRDEELRAKIEHEVIPNVSRSLKPQLEQRLNEIEQEQLEKISKEFKESISGIIASINSATEENEHNVKSVDERNRLLDRGIAELTVILNNIKKEFV